MDLSIFRRIHQKDSRYQNKISAVGLSEAELFRLRCSLPADIKLDCFDHADFDKVYSTNCCPLAVVWKCETFDEHDLSKLVKLSSRAPQRRVPILLYVATSAPSCEISVAKSLRPDVQFMQGEIGNEAELKKFIESSKTAVRQASLLNYLERNLDAAILEGDYEKARQVIDGLSIVDPRYQEYLAVIAAVMIGRREFSYAEKTLIRAASICPDSIRVKAITAVLYAEQGKSDEVREIFLSLKDAPPSLIGRMLLGLGDLLTDELGKNEQFLKLSQNLFRKFCRQYVSIFGENNRSKEFLTLIGGSLEERYESSEEQPTTGSSYPDDSFRTVGSESIDDSINDDDISRIDDRPVDLDWVCFRVHVDENAMPVSSDEPKSEIEAYEEVVSDEENELEDESVESLTAEESSTSLEEDLPSESEADFIVGAALSEPPASLSTTSEESLKVAVEVDEAEDVIRFESATNESTPVKDKPLEIVSIEPPPKPKPQKKTKRSPDDYSFVQYVPISIEQRKLLKSIKDKAAEETKKGETFSAVENKNVAGPIVVFRQNRAGATGLAKYLLDLGCPQVDLLDNQNEFFYKIRSLLPKCVVLWFSKEERGSLQILADLLEARDLKRFPVMILCPGDDATKELQVIGQMLSFDYADVIPKSRSQLDRMIEQAIKTCNDQNQPFSRDMCGSC